MYSNGYSILQDPPVASSPLTDIFISDERIISIIRSINPNKAYRLDKMPGKVIRLSNSVLVLPLKMIFAHSLKRDIFLKTGNLANLQKKNE